MRLTFAGRLVYSLLGYAVMAWGAPQTKSSMEEVVEALCRVRQFREISISPDGARVAWVQSREDPVTGAESLSIYARESHRAGAAARVTAGNGSAEFHEHSIAWSPDGKHLAFLSDAEKQGQLQLYNADMPEGRVRRLTNVTGALQQPSWSPDGKSLAILFTENAPGTPGPFEPVAAATGVISEPTSGSPW